MIKKILFATDTCGMTASANGICVEQIANEFLLKGYEVHIMCFGSKKELKNSKNRYYHIVPIDIVRRMMNISKKSSHKQIKRLARMAAIGINRLEGIMFLHWYPVKSPISCIIYYYYMTALQRKFSFDAVIVSYCPIEAILAAYKMKRKLDVKTCMYTLDTLSDYFSYQLFDKNFRNKKGYEWEKKFFKRMDLILNPKCHEKHFEDNRYNEFREKMEIIDFPHIVPHKVREKSEYHEKTQLQLVYAGAIRKEAAEKMLKCLEPLLMQEQARLDIYGYNSIGSFGSYYEKNALKNVRLRGSIEHKKMLEIEENADILVSIGNSGENKFFVPSKIFEYISLGGKILHFCAGKDDSCLPYFEKYANCCIIDTTEDEEFNRNKIKTFARERKQKISYDNIEKLFPMNTPRYTVNLIANRLLNDG